MPAPPPAAPLRIGSLELSGRFFLAPLAGVSDWPFRVLAREQGASLAYTEMVSSEGLTRGGDRTHSYLERPADEAPFAVQLFGAHPPTMARAAAEVEQLGADLIDINAGCPVKKVCRGGSGASLLQEPTKLAEVIAAMVAAVSVPVQVKVRLGWDVHSINVVEVARLAHEAGAAAIAIHGRTRSQAYEGHADWGPIARVKAEVPGLVVIGNGDVTDAPTALRRLAESGVDAVMIGRGACGNPWIFREIDALLAGRPVSGPTPAEWRSVIRRHLAALIERRGGDERRAVREFRGHLGWYSRGRPGASAFRAGIAELHTSLDVERALDLHFPPEAFGSGGRPEAPTLDPAEALDVGPLSRAWG
ncbi:MAG: tRNA dihydrouridine synthase DusB [Deltaproteobacteria bacterium]|nr:tRNA dihydrouridine synthase DusB [Deltaproteobacteria bacterium]